MRDIIDLSNFNIPESQSLGIRIQENFYQFGIKYIQAMGLIVILGGIFSNNLLILIISYLGWTLIKYKPDLLDLIPENNFINTAEKKMILIVIANCLCVLAITGTSLLSYVGLGCVIVMLHASLWRSPSTQNLQNTDQMLLPTKDIDDREVI
ncbi:hypothetical protein pb186bvf_009022 [Paramecium bursaria]